MLHRWEDSDVLTAAEVRDMQYNFGGLAKLAESYGGWPAVRTHVAPILVSVGSTLLAPLLLLCATAVVTGQLLSPPKTPLSGGPAQGGRQDVQRRHARQAATWRAAGRGRLHVCAHVSHVARPPLLSPLLPPRFLSPPKPCPLQVHRGAQAATVPRGPRAGGPPRRGLQEVHQDDARHDGR